MGCQLPTSTGDRIISEAIQPIPQPLREKILQGLPL